MRKYRNIKYNNTPRRVTKYSEEWIQYRKHRGSNSVKVEYCDLDDDGFDDSIVRDWRSPALLKQQICGIPRPQSGPRQLQASANSIVADPGYVDYSSISFDFTYTGDFSAFSSYEYSISTDASDEAAFEANIVQTVTSPSQLLNKLYSDLEPQVVYYVRVKATGAGGAVYSNFSSNTALGGQISDPCTEFSVTRTDDGDGTYTLTVTTNLANEGVFVSEALNDVDIRGLVRPLSNDQYQNIFLAVVEGTGFDAAAQTTGGRAVFDTGFLKYRGHEWDQSYAANVYDSAVPAQFPFLVNAIKYTSRQFGKSDKVLYLNDSVGHPTTTGKYDVTDFDATIQACSILAGKTMSFFKDGVTVKSHYQWFLANDANETVQTYLDYLNQFDTMVMVSAAELGSAYFSDHFIEAIHTYMDQGGGLIGLNDHGIFQWNSNAVVSKFGFQFTGNVDRDPGNPQYKVSTILQNKEYLPSGYHPLFENLHPTARIAAGDTEGVITYYDTTTGMNTSTNPLPTARTSSYSSGSNKSVVITEHTDANNTALTGGKLIIRTASGCGAIINAAP